MRDIRSITDNQQATFEINNLGREHFEKYGFKPIPLFVIALYMTARTFINEIKSIHQFVSMAKYRCMSLLQAQVVTEEVHNFAEIAEDEGINIRKKIDLLQKAIESQKEVTRQTRKELRVDNLFVCYIYTLSEKLRILDKIVCYCDK